MPEQKIKLRHGDVLIINTMEGNTMINFLKRFIAGGFQVGPAGDGWGPAPAAAAVATTCAALRRIADGMHRNGRLHIAGQQSDWTAT